MPACVQVRHLKVWKIDPRSIKLQKKIAEGSYGEVSQGLYGSFPCAVKMIRKELRMFDAVIHTRDFENEIELLQGLRHANIVFFYGWGASAWGLTSAFPRLPSFLLVFTLPQWCMVVAWHSHCRTRVHCTVFLGGGCVAQTLILMLAIPRSGC